MRKPATKGRLTWKWAYRHYDKKCMNIYDGKSKACYIKQADMECDHEFSLSYQDYVAIMKCYVKYLKQYLLQGDKYTIPYGCGFLQFQKKRTPTTDFWWKFVVQEDGTRKRIRMKNDHTRNFVLSLKWNFNIYKPRFARYFSVAPAFGFRKEIAQHLRSDFSKINNFEESRRSTTKKYKKKDD